MDKYISKYSNGKSVSSAQYITEIICEKKAKFDGKDLHYRFWTNKEWARFYRDQIATSNKLLKNYSAKAILAALNDSKAYKIYSLRSPYIIPLIEKHEKILASKNCDLTLELKRDNKIYKKDTTNTKGIISKLKDLDND